MPVEPQTAAPSPEAIAAGRNYLAFDAIAETAGHVESLAVSLGESAWRGDRRTVEVHLKQLRACVVTAIDAFKMIEVGA